MIQIDPPLDNAALIARDSAELLSRHSVGGIIVSVAASSFLSYMVVEEAGRPSVIAWWLCMIAGLTIRSVDALLARQRWRSPAWQGNQEIRRFGCGVALSGLIWAAFPLIFFPSLDQVGRTSMAIILSAMAGGSATVLAPSLALSIGYSAAMLIPCSLMFFHAGGVENQTLGTLGMIFFAIMVLSSRVSHASTMTAIRLSRTNQGLLREVEGQRNRAEQTNADLKTAQFALRQANLSLETRIKERTIDLELEIAERERYAQQLSRLASTDSLTGLFNRAMLGDRLV